MSNSRSQYMSHDYQQPPQGLPYSQACENNKAPILQVLSREFADARRVLEIGSGTGQHAVYFAKQLPHLIWQTSDVTANHPTINQWLSAYPSDNLRRPIELDLRRPIEPAGSFDAVFTANTLHIIAWPLVERLFALVAEILPIGGKFGIYGPFNYQGQFTSDSNRQFDALLKGRDPNSGIRDISAIERLAQVHGLSLQEDYAMPANNRLLLFASTAAKPTL